MARTSTIVALWAILGLPSPAAADPGTRVIITGRAAGTTPAAEEEAKLDALRVAVSRVCGVFINAQSEVQDFTTIRDKVLEQPVGFARVVRIIKGPEKLEGFTQIQLEAEVFPAAFERRWAEFAHVKQREGNPRCVIVVLEDDDPLDGVPARPNGLVQTELESFFLGKDVRLMDQGVSDKVRLRDLQLAAETGDLAKAAAAGAAFKADVVVLGKAEAREGDSISVGGQRLKRWNVTLTIRAVQTDSAAVLVSKTYRPTRKLTSTSASGKDALTRVAADNAPEILADIGEAWRRRATVGKMAQITLEPCTRRQFKAIQTEMVKLKGISGGKDGFALRELANRVASVEANWKYDLNQLADRFEELVVTCDDHVLHFEVTEQSANRITVRVHTAPTPAVQTAPASPAARIRTMRAGRRVAHAGDSPEWVHRRTPGGESRLGGEGHAARRPRYGQSIRARFGRPVRGRFPRHGWLLVEAALTGQASHKSCAQSGLHRRPPAGSGGIPRKARMNPKAVGPQMTM